MIASIPVIDPHGVYRPDQARELLGLKKNCLAREFRLGRLRMARRGGLNFIMGAWLLDWLKAGEAHPASARTLPAIAS